MPSPNATNFHPVSPEPFQAVAEQADVLVHATEAELIGAHSAGHKALKTDSFRREGDNANARANDTRAVLNPQLQLHEPSFRMPERGFKLNFDAASDESGRAEMKTMQTFIDRYPGEKVAAKIFAPFHADYQKTFAQALAFKQLADHRRVVNAWAYADEEKRSEASVAAAASVPSSVADLQLFYDASDSEASLADFDFGLEDERLCHDAAPSDAENLREPDAPQAAPGMSFAHGLLIHAQAYLPRLAAGASAGLSVYGGLRWWGARLGLPMGQESVLFASYAGVIAGVSAYQSMQGVGAEP